MAFDAFLNQDKAKPRKGRRLTYMLSLGFHAALLIVGVIYSFWQVEELSPPTVTVTIMAAPPPPPPPPPPKKRSSTKPKVQPVTIVQPRPNQIVQPKEEPEPVEDDDGEDDGVEGGVEGGTPGGTVGGVIGGVVESTGPAAAPPPPPEPPKVLPPAVGAKQKLHAPDPELPEAFQRLGTVYNVMVKICVSAAGTVSGVTVLKGADPLIDASTVNTVKSWKFTPFTINNNPVPFCYATRFVFETKK